MSAATVLSATALVIWRTGWARMSPTAKRPGIGVSIRRKGLPPAVRIASSCASARRRARRGLTVGPGWGRTGCSSEASRAHGPPWLRSSRVRACLSPARAAGSGPARHRGPDAPPPPGEPERWEGGGLGGSGHALALRSARRLISSCGRSRPTAGPDSWVRLGPCGHKSRDTRGRESGFRMAPVAPVLPRVMRPRGFEPLAYRFVDGSYSCGLSA